MPVERVSVPRDAGERQMLTAWLDRQRATLALKCDGLSDDQLREKGIPPSGLSLLGLIRHMAEVERNWFRPLLAGEQMAGIWSVDQVLDPEPAFDEVATADVAEAFAAWRAETRGGPRFSLRWVMIHMIEEYARHNGHADLLRERIDGSTGE
jgi:uncharacterized damage-inducible protein DinB